MPTTGKGFAFFLIYYLHRHYILCKSMGYEYEHAMQYAPNTCTRLTKYLQYFSSLLFKSLLTYFLLIGSWVGLLIMHQIELPSGGSQGIFSIQLSKKQLNKHIGSPVRHVKQILKKVFRYLPLDSWVCAGPTIWGSLHCVIKNFQSEPGVQVYTYAVKQRGFFTDVGRQQKKTFIVISWHLLKSDVTKLLAVCIHITNSNLERLWVLFPYSIGFLHIFLIRSDHNSRQQGKKSHYAWLNSDSDPRM